MRWAILFVVLAGCAPEKQQPPPREVTQLTTTRFNMGAPSHPFPLQSGVEAGPIPTAFVADVGSNNATLRIRLDDGEALWGFGERFDAFNLRGRVVESWLVDAWGGGSKSYFAVPFFISSEGYGLFVNCSGKVKFDSRGDELRIEVPEAGIDAFLFRGTPREILHEYTKVVGRPRPVPDWVFQPWISRNSYLSAHDVDRAIDKMEEHKLRAGAVVLEAWAESLQNFRFEQRRYPNTREWIERLHQRGYHVVCWETPSLWDSASTYPTAKTNGWLVLNPDGTELRIDWLENAVKMDFRKPEARDWWTQLHRPLVEMGVDGFKTDGGERMPDPWFHNLHPFYYQRAVLDAFAMAGKTGITFARAASAPCAGNSTFWGGDQSSEWRELPRVVRSGLSAAMSGFSLWGHDIGGYAGTPTKKLYLRWLELGAFSPIMQLHGTTPREPWYYDDETVRIAKFYFDVRWALQTYLLALAKAEALLWRPLAMQFPNDPKTFAIDDEFMLGDDLLVAPVLNEFDERTIYLPAGEWMDVWTGEKHAGPKSWLAKPDIWTIPVFARAGTSWKFPTPPHAEPVTLELAGQTNERGIVPDRRIVRGQTHEKLFVTVRNRSPRDIAGTVTLEAPSEASLLPGKSQRFTAVAGSEARLAFYAALADTAPVDSYTIRIRCTVGEPVIVTLVKLPSWRVTGTNNPKWHEVVPSSDGFVDVGQAFDGKPPGIILGEAKFMSPAAQKVRLWVGSGDSISIQLNGELLLDEKVFRSPERDENWTDVTLQEGENVLLVKQFRDIAPAGWYIRFSSGR